MDKPVEDHKPRGLPHSLRGSQGTSLREQTSSRLGGEGTVNVQVPMTLYETLSHRVERMGYLNVADYVVQMLRDEVNRDECDNGTTGYSKREIELIRRLLGDVEFSD